MLTGGIDMGLAYAKAVLLCDGKVVARGKTESGGAQRAENAGRLWRELLREAGAEETEVGALFATGKGKLDVPFATGRVTEPLAAARACRALCADATALVDVGADETLVVILREDGALAEMVVNEKCAAGLGLFLEEMAERLELALDEMSLLPPPGVGEAVVNDSCVNFAQLDALELLNRGAPPRQVAAACTRAAAVRACCTVDEITCPNWDRVVLAGGVAHNRAFVEALEKDTGITFVACDEAEYTGAIGAALLAADHMGG